MSVPAKNISGLYLISDTSVSKGRGHEELVREGIAGGASAVQLREKWLSPRELYPIALRLREMTRAAGVLFIINDFVELAMAVDADGVHLGQQDLPAQVARKLLGPAKLIGVSTHSLEEANVAVMDGADYIGYGPVFQTETKDAGEVKGPDGIRQVRRVVGLPIVAIGGIDADNAGSVIEAGADAVAVISAINAADDIRAAAGRIAALFRR